MDNNLTDIQQFNTLLNACAYFTGNFVRRYFCRITADPDHRQGWMPALMFPEYPATMTPELSLALILEMTHLDTSLAERHSSGPREERRLRAASRQPSSYCEERQSSYHTHPPPHPHTHEDMK